VFVYFVDIGGLITITVPFHNT